MKSDTALTYKSMTGQSSTVLPTRIITYAWGEKYVDELLSFTLPAALAPGNLPYVASVVPCEMVVVTQENYFSSVLNNSAVARIRDLCPVKLIGLDDLIVSPDKYGMALTYALHRGFADLGPAVTDSWLMFLNADFVIADGCLRSLVNRLAAGERLVAAPSYCVDKEAVIPMLLDRIDPVSRTLSMSHRELADVVLRYRHNTIRAKTVNQSLVSIRYMDQFYWEVDDKTLLGHQMPIAIVGMHPERYVSEPNSQWDHGLMNEFAPDATSCVIGNSDEFLMLELRGKTVAEDQLRLGWPEPAEIACNMRSYITAYQRDMGRYPLTLHAGELPPEVETARQLLRVYRDSVLTHLPAVLPSHLAHPQWDYHRRGFIKGRHDYLSKRLGQATEQAEPAEGLSELDRLWWKLDGLKKSYARRRAEILELQEHQRNALVECQTAILRQQEMLDKKLAMEFTKATACSSPDDDLERWYLLGNGGAKARSDIASDQEPPLCAPLSADAAAWAAFEEEARPKRAAIARALEQIEGHYKSQLAMLELEYQSSRRPIQSAYDQLVNRGAVSAAIPNVIVRRGPLSRPAPAGSLLYHAARVVYQQVFGAVPRVTKLHPYWAPLRHAVRLVDRAALEGATNVIIVSKTGVSRIADALPGTHAEVALADVLQGNLAAAFNRSPDFDLCICMLDAEGEFSAIVKAVVPSLRKGARIIGFYSNFDLAPSLHVNTKLMAGLLNTPGSIRIYYAGSERSARVLRSFHDLTTAARRGRLHKGIRVATALFLLAPSAFVANHYENRISQEQRPPKNCSSVTIEVSV